MYPARSFEALPVAPPAMTGMGGTRRSTRSFEIVVADAQAVVHAGATLRRWMDDSHTALDEVVRRTTRTTELIEHVLRGDVAVDDELALDLHTATGLTSDIWRNLERAFRVGLDQGKRWQHEIPRTPSSASPST